MMMRMLSSPFMSYFALCAMCFLLSFYGYASWCLLRLLLSHGVCLETLQCYVLVFYDYLQCYSWLSSCLIPYLMSLSTLFSKKYGLGMILEHFIAKVRLASEKPAPSLRSPCPGLQDPLCFFAPRAFLI